MNSDTNWWFLWTSMRYCTVRTGVLAFISRSACCKKEFATSLVSTILTRWSERRGSLVSLVRLKFLSLSAAPNYTLVRALSQSCRLFSESGYLLLSMRRRHVQLSPIYQQSGLCLCILLIATCLAPLPAGCVFPISFGDLRMLYHSAREEIAGIGNFLHVVIVWVIHEVRTSFQVPSVTSSFAFLCKS